MVVVSMGVSGEGVIFATLFIGRGGLGSITFFYLHIAAK